MEPLSDEVKAWLYKGSSDLFAAQILIEHSPLALGLSDMLEVSPEEAQQALAAAQTVWRHVLGFLPWESPV